MIIIIIIIEIAAFGQMLQYRPGELCTSPPARVSWSSEWRPPKRLAWGADSRTPPGASESKSLGRRLRKLDFEHAAQGRSLCHTEAWDRRPGWSPVVLGPGRPHSSPLLFVVFHICCVFYKLKAGPPTGKKVTIALLRWPGGGPTVSLRSAELRVLHRRAGPFSPSSWFRKEQPS